MSTSELEPRAQEAKAAQPQVQLSPAARTLASHNGRQSLDHLILFLEMPRKKISPRPDTNLRLRAAHRAALKGLERDSIQ